MARFFSLLLGALLFWGSPLALATDDPGIPVTVRVLDAEGLPIATAVVRHIREGDRHPVNTENGEWTAQILYFPDGTEFPFDKGTVLDLEVSAPGYLTNKLQYVVRKRKNLIVVELEKFEIVTDEDEDDIVVGFGRDRPIER